MKTVDYKELILAMDELEKERGIKKDYLIESLETALMMAYKKNFDSRENAKVTINPESGEVHLYTVKKVVEEVEDPDLEINAEEASKVDKKLAIGDDAYIEIIPKDFGRIAAQTGKQVMVQKIREAERNLTYTEYSDKKGQIVSGIVQKVENGLVIVDLGKLEGYMPEKEQIPTENYYVNQNLKGYVINVERGAKGNPQVVFSRSHPDFVRKLFEFEIPEIYENLIEVKSVSRDAGSRSKVAVYSSNPNIDPVGSCVGQKGVRIQNIINELNGEKIDVIEWNEDPSIYIASALLPAKVLAVDVKEEKFAQVIVPDDQLSLAIGKCGQNARLAARLTGWKIDIKSETQFRELLQAQSENEGETLVDNEENEEELLNNEAENDNTAQEKTSELEDSIEQVEENSSDGESVQE